MIEPTIAIAGVNTLPGQHLLARLAASEQFRVTSFHDKLALQGIDSIADSPDWSLSANIAETFRQVPLLAPDAPAQASLLASFLPDDDAQRVETKHLARGTRVITHAEYARLALPMVVPGRLHELDHGARHLATPNCTTAMCSLPLGQLHAVYGIRAATITTMQAISGTDLPGMHAHAIHDQVVGHLPGEADALRDELGAIFSHAFPIIAFATRVPVWRGHTITLSLQLEHSAELIEIEQTLRATPGVNVVSPADRMSTTRPLFDSDGPMVTLGALRSGSEPGAQVATLAGTQSDTLSGTDSVPTSGGRSIMMTLTGDNLEAATSGLMLAALEYLVQADSQIA